MSDIMRFDTELQRRRTANPEPTVPGPVEDDVQRAWNGYPIPNHEAAGAALGTVGAYVDSDTGNDANPGTSLLPKETLQASVDILTALTPNVVILGGTFRERVRIHTHPEISFIPGPGITPTIAAPTEYGPIENCPSHDTTGFISAGAELGKGDYMVDNTGGLLRYHMPDVNRANRYYTAVDGHNATFYAAGVPATQWITHIQHSVFNNLLVGARIKRDAAYLVRLNAIDVSNAAGVFPFTFPNGLQVPGTSSGDTNHYKGNGLWNGWVCDIIRNPHNPMKICVATLNKPIAAGQQFLAFWTFDPVLNQWVFISEMGLAPNSSGAVYNQFVQLVNLRRANDKIYCMNYRTNTTADSWLVSTGGVFTSLDSTMFPFNLSSNDYGVIDITYYKGNYYLIATSGIYRSVNGLDGWALIQAYDKNALIPWRFCIVNNVLFVTHFKFPGGLNDASSFAYTYDGLIWHRQDITSNYFNGPFEINGRLTIVAGSSQFPGPVVIPLWKTFQEALVNIETTNQHLSDNRFENIYFDGRDTAGQIKAGAAVTSGQRHVL